MNQSITANSHLLLQKHISSTIEINMDGHRVMPSIQTDSANIISFLENCHLTLVEEV